MTRFPTDAPKARVIKAFESFVEGFYEGTSFSKRDRDVMRSVPDDEQALLEFFGVAQPDRVGDSLQEAINFPSLNLRGLESGWVGEESRTIIPDRAVAEIDVRLVKETPPDLMASRILAHIRKQGYTVVDSEPGKTLRHNSGKLVKVVIGDRTEAYRSPPTHPQAEQLIRALRDVWEKEPVLIRTSGGTVPIGPFIQALGFPAFSLPIVNFDNNQHSPNENLRLGHLFEGIVSVAAILGG